MKLIGMMDSPYKTWQFLWRSMAWKFGEPAAIGL